MNATTRAQTQFKINDLIAKRWSPYAYSDRMVEPDDLRSLFEAARWAPSSYNEQPWRYIVATRDEPEEFARLLSCLTERNQEWAQAAPVLAIGVVKKNFARDSKPNRHAGHDLGLASENLCLEATSRGILVHQMAGILPDRVRELYDLPEDVEALTGIAIGYYGDPSTLSEARQRSDSKRRPRRPLAETVFTGRWGKSAGFLT